MARGKKHIDKKKRNGVACPVCRIGGTRCTDSRPIRGGVVTMRRRHCAVCHKRFTTYERAASAQNPPDRSFVRRVEVALSAAQTAFERLSEMAMILSEIEEETQYRHTEEKVT
jgi:transcriptional regulator NrdR family protein